MVDIIPCSLLVTFKMANGEKNLTGRLRIVAGYRRKSHNLNYLKGESEIPSTSRDIGSTSIHLRRKLSWSFFRTFSRPSPYQFFATRAQNLSVSVFFSKPRCAYVCLWFYPIFLADFTVFIFCACCELLHVFLCSRESQ
jgi:hypothetical protein